MPVVRTLIPRKMRIGSRQYSIEILETMKEKRLMGRISYTAQTIKIGRHSNVTNRKFTNDEVQDSFWHEVIHGILYDMGRDTLNKNEQFVTGFAHRLTKAIKSARF